MIVLGIFLSIAFLFLQIRVPFFHQLPVLALAPFLTLAALLRPLREAILWSGAAGLILDCLSSDPFAIHSLTYSLTMLLVFRWRRRFSAEVPLQFGIYSALFSVFSSILQIGLLFLFDRRISFQGKWWMVDWPLLAVADAVYAIVWFSGPLAIFSLIRRIWGIYWLKKNKTKSHLYQN